MFMNKGQNVRPITNLLVSVSAFSEKVFDFFKIPHRYQRVWRRHSQLSWQRHMHKYHWKLQLFVCGWILWRRKAMSRYEHTTMRLCKGGNLWKIGFLVLFIFCFAFWKIHICMTSLLMLNSYCFTYPTGKQNCIISIMMSHNVISTLLRGIPCIFCLQRFCVRRRTAHPNCADKSSRCVNSLKNYLSYARCFESRAVCWRKPTRTSSPFQDLYKTCVTPNQSRWFLDSTRSLFCPC